MNDLKLQLALAQELPALIGILLSTDDPEFWWKGSEEKLDEAGFLCFEYVTPREWDWVIRECEKKLTEVQKAVYAEIVNDLIKEGGLYNDWYSGWSGTADSFTRGLFDILNTPWQTRATAYFKTIRKPI